MLFELAQPPKENGQLYPPSVIEFCHVINQHLYLVDDLGTLASICEQQAETVQITPRDMSPDTLELMLNTIQNLLHHMRGQHIEVRHAKPMNKRLKSLRFWTKKKPAECPLEVRM